MKQKLLNALKERYKNLGLAEAAFVRVATFGETFITSDEQIESFVQAAEATLKAEQSEADRVRGELNAKIKGLEGEKADLEAKLKDGNNPPEEASKPQDTPDIASIVAQAVATAVAPLQEKLTAFETANSQKSAIAALDEFVSTWDYAKGFPQENEDSYERVMELFEVGGKKWTAEELTAKYIEKFNKAVAKKGVTDTTKPYQSDGGGDTDADFSAFDKAAEKLGWAKPE